jgi:hypothetical protein
MSAPRGPRECAPATRPARGRARPCERERRGGDPRADTPRPARRAAHGARRVCPADTAPGQTVRALRSPPGSALIERPETPRTGGPRHEHHSTLDPDLLAFARWFADWWLRRGRDLTDPTRHSR